MTMNLKGPKSICVCGHSGDGLNSQHATIIAPGHAHCTVPGCQCQKFTWARYANEYLAALYNDNAQEGDTK